MHAVRPQPLFLPKLASTLRGYTSAQLAADATAGVIVGIVALPLAIAFAIASGVTPDRGLVTAIIAGLIIALLGGSRVQIGGPTGAFVIIVYGIVEQHGVNGLILCTLMAGVILVLMGALQLGAIIKFIPYPLTVGFTSGIAVVIFSSQIRDLLGLHMAAPPADFLEKWAAYLEALHTADPVTMGLSALSLAIIAVWPRINRRLPGSIVAILAVTALTSLLRLPVETIGSRFGDLPAGLPGISWPSISLEAVQSLLGPAFTVALLGAIESLLSATVADSMIEGRHRSNTELIAQGIANIVTPLFGGIPATGAIARTVTNIKNGGRTPVAGVVHALTLWLIVALFGRWAGLIPLCALAAILVVVAWHMSERHAFQALLRAPRMDVAVLLVTFALTVLMDLTVAVEIGLMMSVFLFMKRMVDVTTVRQVTEEMRSPRDEASLRREKDAVSRRTIPKGVEVYEAEGAFFFGVAELLRDTLDVGRHAPMALILRMRHVMVLDASGIRALNDLHHRCVKAGTTLILEGIHAQPLAALVQADLLGTFGESNVVPDLDAALARADVIRTAGSTPPSR
jgi:SulP family sulfate permease